MSLRILYVGNDQPLYKFLRDTLEMTVVQCVGQSDAMLFIKGIDYSAILLDESNRELEAFIRGIKAHKKTPVIFACGSPEHVAESVRSSLERPSRGARTGHDR